MKSIIKRFGIIAIVVGIWFSMSTCDLEENGNNNNIGGSGSSSSKAVELTYNTWHSGFLPEPGSSIPREQWFKFTATANTHYFHFKGEGQIFNITGG
jgi:hypothetical protein